MTLQLWDAFYVNDELELAEVRMELLSDVVDRFVILEADRTFVGETKPLHVQENLARFDRWRDRLELIHAELPAAASDAWEREYTQRRIMGKYLQARATPQTLLVVGDVDELPDPAALRELKTAWPSKSIRLGMAHANYYANWVMKTEWDLGPIAFTLAEMHEAPVAHLLGDRGLNERSREGYRRGNSGWHLSFLGGPDRMRSKLRAYSHQDFATEANLRPGHLERCMRWGSTFTGYHVLKKQRREDLDDVQRFVLQRRPEWFNFEHRSTYVRAHAYNGYCRKALTGTLSSTLERLTRASPNLVTTLLMPYFLAVDTRRRLRDRAHPH